MDAVAPRSHRAGAVLVLILLAAALLRLPWLDRHDLMDDEALYSLRGIGYFDTWFGSMKSPVELFDVEPWWQNLSFHDHPPLAFLTQHLSFELLGITVLAARLPFALAGIATIVAAYLLGHRLAGRRYGLWTAAVLAAANYHVWISRVAFIEALLLLWVVLALWLLARSLDDSRTLLWLGLTLGLGLITKYSALVLLPTVLVVLGCCRSAFWRNRQCWLAAGLTLALLSPVITYNAMLFATRGHFDATLWSMLGQRHADFATNDQPYSHSFAAATAWLRWLPQGFDLLTLGLAVAGGAMVLGRRRPLGAPSDRRAWVLGSYTTSTVAFLSLSPGRKQYVALLIPVVALAAAVALERLSVRWRVAGTAVALAAVAAAALVSVNSQLRLRPVGPAGLTALTLRPTSYAYRVLDDELDSVYAGQPLLEFPLTYPQYIRREHELFQAKIAAGARAADPQVKPPLVIWDSRFDYAAVRWTFLRRSFYLHQPMINSGEAVRFTGQVGPESFTDAGFRRIIFIFPEPKLLGEHGGSTTSTGALVRSVLDAHGEQPRIVRDRLGDPAFAVYETSTLAFFPRRMGDFSEPTR